jgi:hypothetical protein
MSADLGKLVGDGVSLYQNCRSDPIGGSDPSGLWVSDAAGLAGDVVVLGIRGVRGGLESMVSEYASNMESDLDWAMDWTAGDDLYSRTSNEWVAESFNEGMTAGFEDGFDELKDKYDPFGLMPGQSGDGPAMALSLKMSGGGMMPGFIKGIMGGAVKITNYAKRNSLVTKMVEGWGQVTIRYNRRGFPEFGKYVKDRVFVRHSGNRGRDIDAANAKRLWKETPAGYTWHHHQNMREMLLVPYPIHKAFGHTGGHARMLK